jgi:iron(III) transport system permease protein
VATAAIVPAAVAVVFARRVRPGRLRAAIARIAAMGYALPGTVLAIGILPVVTGVDARVHAIATSLFGASPGLLLLGSGAALVYAYFVRFLAVAIGGVDAGFSRVPASLDDAAHTLAHTPGQTLRRVHLPLLRPALAAAALLVLIDSLKELPATLLLRPVGFETLATQLYGEAVRGTYEDGAIAALLIVAVGLVPVAVLSRVR